MSIGQILSVVIFLALVVLIIKFLKSILSISLSIVITFILIFIFIPFFTRNVTNTNHQPEIIESKYYEESKDDPKSLLETIKEDIINTFNNSKEKVNHELEDKKQDKEVKDDNSTNDITYKKNSVEWK